MSNLRPWMRRASVVLAALCGVFVMVSAAGCGDDEPPPVKAAPKPAPKPAPVKPADPPKVDKFAELKKKMTDVQPRIDAAMAKLDEALKLKAEKYDTAKTAEEAQVVGKQVRHIKDAGLEIWNKLQEEADALDKDLWTKSFSVEDQAWARKIKPIARIGS